MPPEVLLPAQRLDLCPPAQQHSACNCCYVSMLQSEPSSDATMISDSHVKAVVVLVFRAPGIEGGGGGGKRAGEVCGCGWLRTPRCAESRYSC